MILILVLITEWLSHVVYVIVYIVVYVIAYVVDVVINVTKCKSQNEIKEKIIQLKEYYYGNDGKALAEALLYIREDRENVTKQDMKTYFLSCFDPK